MEIQEPILRGDFATFHFDPTLPGMLGSTLLRYGLLLRPSHLLPFLIDLHHLDAECPSPTL